MSTLEADVSTIQHDFAQKKTEADEQIAGLKQEIATISTQLAEQLAERARLEEETAGKIKELEETNAELVGKTESLADRVNEEETSSKEVKKMEKQLKVCSRMFSIVYINYHPFMLYDGASL